MVYQEMGSKWIVFSNQFLSILISILAFGIQECWSLNSEGLALLEFRAIISFDPYEAFANWNPNNDDPCTWLGVLCVNGNVQTLDLNGLNLEGTLSPEIEKLSHLRSLILSKNRFYGPVPIEIGGLKALEVLDLRDNDLSGTIPAEIGGLLSVKQLYLCGNKFKSIHIELGRLNSLDVLQFDENLTFADGNELGCVNRKFGHRIGQTNYLKQLNKADTLIPLKGAINRYLTTLLMSKFGKGSLPSRGDNCCSYFPSSSEQYIQNEHSEANFARRGLLEQSSNNLEALPAPFVILPETTENPPSIQSSGSFPAVPGATKKQISSTSSPDPPTQQNPDGEAPNSPPSSDSSHSKNLLKYILVGSGIALLLIIVVVMVVLCKRRGVRTIGPWKTGLSGQLQKAFVTGVPKLNRAELETACEDFSNIIETFDGCTVYKGTLSSGVEIAVASTTVQSVKEWSKSSETIYRKKIDTMSRVNHKNFVNLIGYCEEEEPFLRIMVFEYASNGTLYEHLHVKEFEHLDWNARTRIIMGTAYCLQHMHHDLNPPVAHPNLTSSSICFTDDYAAKIADFGFWKEFKPKANSLEEKELEHSELSPLADPETNVYSFGVMLLEIISGKLPYSEEEQISIVNWGSEFLNDRRSIGYMVDPSLKSFKTSELDVICAVAQECIKSDPRQRPTMKEVTAKLREVISITPDAAVPRLSPLWWAELEILSVEAT